MKEQFTARMLRIHFGEDDRWQGKPCTRPSWPGVWSWRFARPSSSAESKASDRVPASALQPLELLQGRPIQMSIIDTEEQIARLTQFLDAMVEEGWLPLPRSRSYVTREGPENLRKSHRLVRR